MAFKIIIDRDAFADIQEAASWYNRQSDGLGTRFRKQVKSQINGLRKSALAYGIRYHDVRCMQVHKFPFLVHYVADELNKRVEVFAVLHGGRDPDYAKGRKE